jgi:hypothetical protein
MDTDDFDEEVFEAQRSGILTNVVFAGGLLAATWGIGLFGGGLTPGARIIMIALGTVCAAGILDDTPRRVRVRHSELVAEFLLRTRVVRYADIADVATGTWNTGWLATPYDVIVVTRRHGFRLALKGFEDGIDMPFMALQRRWGAWNDHVHPHWREQTPWAR